MKYIITDEEIKIILDLIRARTTLKVRQIFKDLEPYKNITKQQEVKMTDEEQTEEELVEELDEEKDKDEGGEEKEDDLNPDSITNSDDLKPIMV